MTRGTFQQSSGVSRDRALGYGALIVLTYVVAAHAGFRLAFVADQVTTVWAPTGIALAALLLGGPRLWPAVWLGAFLANAATDAPLWTAPLIASGNTLEAVTATWMLARWIPRFDAEFRRVADVAAFVGLAAVVCTTLSATTGVATLCAAGVQPWAQFGILWFDWWLGDALGAALVAPAILTASREPWSRRRSAVSLAFTVSAAAVTAFVFGPLFGGGIHPLEFLIFPVVIVTAVVGGPMVTSLVVLSVSALAIGFTVGGIGPFAGPDVHASLVLLQVFMGVLGVTALLLAAAVAERQRAERSAQETARVLGDREEMLRLAQRAGGVAAFEWDFRNQTAQCSAEFFRIFGLPARDGVMTGAEWGQHVHEDDRDRMAAHLARALDGVEPAAADYRIRTPDGRTRWLSYAGQLQRTPAGDRLRGTVVDITDRKHLESELRRHADEVERIIESIGEGFVALDREFRYVYVNQPAEQMLGRPRAELIGRRPWDVFPPEVVNESRQQFEAAMASWTGRRFETHVPSWNRWFEARIYPSAAGLSVFFADISARVEADAALRESRDVLALAMRGGAMGAWSRNIATGEVWWSRELLDLFGLPPGGLERTESGFLEYVHPDDRAAVRVAHDDAVRNRTDYVIEFRFTRADTGEWRWMEGRGRAVYGDDGAAHTLYGLGIDVTARKRTERELQQRVLEQEALFDVLPIGIGIATDRACRYIRTNRAFAETLRLPQEINASKTAPAGERPTTFRVLTPEGTEVPDHELPMQVAAREGRAVRDVELDVVHDDGRVVRLLEYAAPLVDEHDVPRGAVGAFVDVTALFEARTTLAVSEERYRRIFETAGVSLWEEDFTAVKAALDERFGGRVEDAEASLGSDPAFVDECIRRVRVLDVNGATLRMVGAATKDDALKSLERIFTPETREVFVGELVAIVRGESRYDAEATVRRLDGRLVHVLVNVAFPTPGRSLDRVLVSLADITDRKMAEAALRQEVEVRTTLSQVGASLARELRSDALVEAVTHAATQLTEADFGAFFYNVADENGGSLQLYALAGAPREAFAAFPHPRATAIFGPTFRGEGIIRLDDVTQDERYGRSAPYHGMPPGHLPVRSYMAVPVIGRGGVVLGGLFFGHSRAGMFTERHEMLASGVAGWAAIALDNARLYRDAEEANRLKDEFLATLSHELRTPLNAVLGWSRMLRQGAVQSSMHDRALESIERNAAAQAQLVDDLLDVSRIVAGKHTISVDPVDLGAVITNAMDTVLAGAAAKGLRLALHLPEGRRIMVTGDADRLQQVVWNLVSNAIKFTPAGGRVDVALQQRDETADIIVRDTGLGIDPSFRPHLFQRFRQADDSKTGGRGGLGLGLSIVRHLVEAHGGSVSADSDGPGRGSTFTVVLPLHAVEPLAAGATDHGGEAIRDAALRGIQVALVDDRADARERLRSVLERAGASVVAVASAGEALHALAMSRFDVLVADIGTPEQDGLAVLRVLRSLPDDARNRDIPAIAVLSSTSARDRELATASGFACQLARPVDPGVLVAAITSTLRPEATQ